MILFEAPRELPLRSTSPVTLDFALVGQHGVSFHRGIIRASWLQLSLCLPTLTASRTAIISSYLVRTYVDGFVRSFRPGFRRGVITESGVRVLNF